MHVEQQVVLAVVGRLQRRARLDVDELAGTDVDLLGRLAQYIVSEPETTTKVSSCCGWRWRRPFAPGS